MGQTDSTADEWTLDGQGHTLNNLYINRIEENNVGLFGQARRAKIENIGLVNCTIRGKDETGGLIGLDEGSTIQYAFVHGQVVGIENVGGLIGKGVDSQLSDNYSLAYTSGDKDVGGIIGWIKRQNSATVYNNYAAGLIRSKSTSGGILGYIDDVSMAYNFFDNQSTQVLSGTSNGNDDQLRIYPISTNNFTVPDFFTNRGWDLVNDWKYAYGRDNAERPVLAWEKIHTIQMAIEGGGSIINYDGINVNPHKSITNIVPHTDSPLFHASPDENHVFSHWLDVDRNIEWTTNPLQLSNIDQNYNLKAVFIPNSGSYTLRFTVRDEVFSPISKAQIVVGGERYYTDADGKVTIQNMADGIYAYNVTKAGVISSSGSIQIQSGDVEEVIIMLKKDIGSDFTFIIRQESIPLTDAVITIQSQEEHTGPQTYGVNDNGELMFSGQGNYSYVVEAVGYEKQVGNFELKSFESPQKRIITLVPAFSLSLHLTDGSQPLSGTAIQLGAQQYVTDVLGNVTIPYLSDGTYTYVVSASGFPTSTRSSTIEGQNVQDTGTLLSPSESVHTISLAITDGFRDVPNALLVLTGQSIIGVNSNSDGEITLHLIDGIYPFRVSGFGYKLYTGTLTVSGKDESIVIQLEGTTTRAIAFEIYGDGSPISGAQLSFEGTNYVADNNGLTQVEEVILHIPYRTVTSAPGFIAMESVMTFEDPSMTFRQIQLNRPQKLTFVLQDRGNPIPGATLLVNGKSYTSDASGEVHLDNAVEGTVYTYETALPGYHEISGAIRMSDSDHVKTLMLSPRSVSFQTIHFTIQSTSVLPIEGAEITFETERYLSDVNGKASIEAVPDGSYPYHVRAEGYQVVRGTLMVNGAEVSETVSLNETLGTKRSISGSIVDHQNQPIENASFEGFPSDLQTDASGTYTVRVDQFWSGKIVPELSGYTFDPKERIISSIEEDLDTIDFIGTATSSSLYQVRFLVQDVAGLPIEGAEVTFEGATYLSDANGEVTVQAVGNGNYSYLVRASGYQPRQSSFVVDGADVLETVVLPLIQIETFRISGEIRDD
ncbi:MAG: hypothetical protein AAF551_08565, partial [Bacteroidota bacterium]